MADALTRLHEAFAARHKLAGDLSRSVGFLTPMVPIELILAADLTPVRLHGLPSQTPTLGDTYMENVVDGQVRSLFDRFLRGDFADFPLVLMPRGSEQFLQLYYYLGEVRNWGEYALPPLKIVDILQMPNEMTARYVRSRLAEVGQALSKIGAPITNASLRDAIVKVNEMRRALQHLNGLRREGRIKGSDMLRMSLLFGTLPPQDFLNLARDVAQSATAPTAGPRIILSGVAQDDPAVYDALEAAGAQVVADDHVKGERVFAHLVDERADPWDALTAYYQNHAPSLRQHPQKELDQQFLKTCRGARIDADLCVLEDCDDTLGWDWPGRRQALEQMRIPSVLLTGRNYFAPDNAALDQAIAKLLDKAKAGAA